MPMSWSGIVHRVVINNHKLQVAKDRPKVGLSNVAEISRKPPLWRGSHGAR